MKRVLLLSLLIVSMFLIGCALEAEESNVVDNPENIAGEAFRKPLKGSPSASSGSRLSESFTTVCQEQVDNCGFAKNKIFKT